MPPWLVLVFVIALLASLGYQILRTTSLRRVPLYWIVITGALLASEAVADYNHLVIVRLGDLAVIPDLFGLVIALAALRLLQI